MRYPALDNAIPRMLAAASAKLGAPVTFAFWREHKTGAQVPVFFVPSGMEAQATALGLEITHLPIGGIMSDQKSHTPGPWTFEVEKSSGPHLTSTYLFAHGDIVGRAYCDSRRDNSQANARLIAAAPDLLAALEEALKYCPVEVQDRARAAVAKATGETK